MLFSFQEEARRVELGHFLHDKDFQTLPCQSSHGHVCYQTPPLDGLLPLGMPDLQRLENDSQCQKVSQRLHL